GVFRVPHPRFLRVGLGLTFLGAHTSSLKSYTSYSLLGASTVGAEDVSPVRKDWERSSDSQKAPEVRHSCTFWRHCPGHPVSSAFLYFPFLPRKALFLPFLVQTH